MGMGGAWAGIRGIVRTVGQAWGWAIGLAVMLGGK